MTPGSAINPNPSAAELTRSGEGVSFRVRVVPRSSKSRVEGIADGAVKVRVTAPPAEGAANEELIEILSKFFKTPKTSIRIASGGSSRTKRVIAGRLSLEEAQRLLASLA